MRTVLNAGHGLALALDEDIKGGTRLVNRAPEPVLFASGGDIDFIEGHLSLRRGACPGMRAKNSRPNFRPHCRIVSSVTEMPCAACESEPCPE